MTPDPKLIEFFELNQRKVPKTPIYPDLTKDIERYDWLCHRSEVPYWEVPLPGLPYEKMFAEAIALKSLFVDHRANDPSQMGARHQGWSSLTVHGISSQHTMNWDSYPEYKALGKEELVPYKWTEIAERIPETVRYLNEIFPHQKYTRVRFMLLRPGGYILPHRDRDHRLLFPINIALNNPSRCEFVMEDNGKVPFEPGKGFMLDLSHRHSVWNRSQEDRIHLIVHWRLPPLHEPKGREWMDWTLKNWGATEL